MTDKHSIAEHHEHAAEHHERAAEHHRHAAEHHRADNVEKAAHDGALEEAEDETAE